MDLLSTRILETTESVDRRILNCATPHVECDGSLSIYDNLTCFYDIVIALTTF